MSKKGLGRGLGALITERETESSEIKEIMLADIVPNPGQPRREFDREKLQELADSIQEHGLLQPILVKPEGSRYIIIAGERRFRATQLAGIDRINCIVRDCTEQEMTEKALIENIQRADLSPVEEGLAYARLIQDYGLTQEQVARRVGKGRPTVANLLRIIQLPAEVLELINKEAISLGHAKVILSLENKEQQISLAKRAVEGLLSVRETETIVQNSEKKVQPAKNAVKTPKNKSYSSLNDIEEKLRHSFQTKVAVSGSEEKGKIEINYYSRDELNRLLERWEIEV
ncbi:MULTISPECIES: ParB/RepB/Spo0J family partition protein [Dehalobacter]|uniref:ParB/RepB/Spo0J family partition protein n=2 Tax=Dehalobacter restrictus TaxID=55583 RepID=A0A857DLY3_9FIRM|nr:MULTISPECIES: ParB/RepB/Spo0J family partition protein [Dehalobacter]AHF11172.1 chromosome partitioning protein ParB [Dehalobacter restrictus DSM 9455]MCG1024201.1 ParB/RepB/Spo0J family partition protein [Dehalobacter sp.]MDJ0305316.1 ParB/RepB/Spo0J family partition protein [Dehalobacter sp.]OCZ49802.1 chromosome partitioning protein ParB [Dehalobacter sp. TeCB1]QHA01813.1 ParB/RepB/Spo0J family partition protein [Dehalobacter restrictus]